MGFDRRAFLKFAGGAGAGIAVSPLPWKLLDDVSIWSQNWSWIPANPRGETTYELTTSKLCPSACGLKVRLTGGMPVRALGNPDHPLGGGLSALAAAEVQLMHSPARVKTPLRRDSGGNFIPIGWEEAEEALAGGLDAAGADIACVSGDETGSGLDVLSAFLGERGSDKLYLMPSEAQSAARAWRLMGGSGQPGYDLESSDFILAVGANVLESWGTFIRNRRIFAAARPHGEEPERGFVYAGPVQNNSAAVADSWIPLKPGSELIFILGLAAILTQRGLSAAAPDFASFREMLAGFDPQKVYALTGVSPQTLQNTAAALLRADRPLVLAGSECNQGGGAAQILAALALNLLLGGRCLRDIPLARPVLPAAEGRQEVQNRDLVAYMAQKPNPQALILYEANPVYALPDPESAAVALRNTPFKVSFSAFMDESSALCDLVLPMPLGLERLDDIESPYGCGKVFYALSRRTLETADTRHGMDILLRLSAGRGGLPASYREVLEARSAALGADHSALEAGEVFEAKAPAPGRLMLLPEILNRAAESKNSVISLALAPVQKIALGTAQTGIPPFNVKTIRGNELSGAEMSIFINSATAYSRGLREGDRVRLAGKHGEIRARVLIFEGIVPDAVGVPMGFGHTALDVFSRNKGANATELFTATPEAGTGFTLWNQIDVSIVKI
ncbi:MAG: molybdopterin-dependent oxidoreductase [Deltaproteobacteria bacterium]|jgi:anaerobic selenocysteine-containing dehydrogenase|nr:molybdopterin-dependent oxidoreductase [Deltaproteobacteria bacterium]